jgi:hypothetical protein
MEKRKTHRPPASQRVELTKCYGELNVRGGEINLKKIKLQLAHFDKQYGYGKMERLHMSTMSYLGNSIGSYSSFAPWPSNSISGLCFGSSSPGGTVTHDNQPILCTSCGARSKRQ